MSKEVIKSVNAPAAIGPYSQAIKAGNTIYCSGMIPVDPKTGAIPSTITQQATQVLENVKALLADNGATMANIVKTTVFIKDMNDFAAVNEVYAKYFTGEYPARSCVEVSRLPKDVLIEMESIVVL